MAQVLVVERDPRLRQLLTRLLVADGHRLVARADEADVAVSGTAHPVVLGPLRASGVPVVLVSPVRAAVPGVRLLVRPPVRTLLDAVARAAGARALPLAG